MVIFKNKEFLRSFFIAMVLLSLSLIINFYAGVYATEKASNAVTDIILSNTPVFDLDGVFIYGSILFWLLVSALLLRTPRYIPFTVKGIALFVIVRAIFISLTHLGPFPTHAIITSNILHNLTFGADLFFSGHVGLPFLLSLIFWDNRHLRIFFILVSIFFAAVVLLAHLHYSIDVLSAYFITYSIYQIARKLFKKDYLIFLQGII